MDIVAIIGIIAEAVFTVTYALVIPVMIIHSCINALVLSSIIIARLGIPSFTPPQHIVGNYWESAVLLTIHILLNMIGWIDTEAIKKAQSSLREKAKWLSTNNTGEA